MDLPPAELRWAHPAAAVALLLLSGSLIWWCYGSASPPGWLPAVGGASLILALVLISTVSSRRRTRVFLAVGGHGKMPSDGHVVARWRS